VSLDIDSEISRLTERRAKLKKLMALQAEVDCLELDTASQHTELVRVIKCVCDVVCPAYSVPPSMLRCERRDAWIIEPRHIAIEIIRRHSGASLTRIGKAFRRDHGTIIATRKAVEGRLVTEPKFAARFKELESLCLEKIMQVEPAVGNHACGIVKELRRVA
jgi:chromosomal replication initiation ATPase DnaA